MALRDLKKYVNIILIAILLSVVFQGAYDTLFYGMKGDNSDAIPKCLQLLRFRSTLRRYNGLGDLET